MPCLIRITPERLFAQHMLAGIKSLDDPLGVLIIREAHVDDVDVRIIEERVVIGTNHQRIEDGRSLRAATCDRLQVRTARRVDGRGHGPRRNPASAEEAPADGHRLPQQLRHDWHAVIECRSLGGLHERDDIARLARLDRHGRSIREELDD